jgi:hypothetical protein
MAKSITMSNESNQMAKTITISNESSQREFSQVFSKSDTFDTLIDRRFTQLTG